ncbi:MAG: nucleotidyltransferase family protein [Eubacteriales bacterium]|nr:nucleotidyltransferase family protein [Eubacteriales bacterium]
MKGIILAAGYATRLYPLTIDRPKALLPVAGKPIIDYIADEMDTINSLDQIIIISNHLFADQFQAWADARNAVGQGYPVVVLDDGSTDDTNKLGAIGDIQFVIDQLHIDDELMVIAGDNLFTYKLHDAWSVYAKHGQDMILAKKMPPEEDLTRYAIATIDESGLVTDLVEKPKNPKSDLAVFATYFYRQDTVPLIRDYLAAGHSPDAPGNFPAWLYTQKPVRLYMFDGICIDIGTPESYAEVQNTFPPVRG